MQALRIPPPEKARAKRSGASTSPPSLRSSGTPRAFALADDLVVFALRDLGEVVGACLRESGGKRSGGARMELAWRDLGSGRWMSTAATRGGDVQRSRRGERLSEIERDREVAGGGSGRVGGPRPLWRQTRRAGRRQAQRGRMKSVERSCLDCRGQQLEQAGPGGAGLRLSRWPAPALQERRRSS